MLVQQSGSPFQNIPSLMANTFGSGLDSFKPVSKELFPLVYKVIEATKIAFQELFRVALPYIRDPQVFGATQAVIGAAFLLTDLYEICYYNVRHCQIDGTLSALVSFSMLGSGVSKISLGLIAAGEVGHPLMHLLTLPLGITASILSTVGVAIQAFGWKRCHDAKLMFKGVNLNLKNDVNAVDVKNLINKILQKDRRLLEKTFLVYNGDHLKRELQQLLSGLDQDQQLKVAKSHLRELKGRVKKKLASHELCLIAESVGIVALGVIITSPMLSLGYFLSAFGLSIQGIMNVLDWKEQQGAYLRYGKNYRI